MSIGIGTEGKTRLFYGWWIVVAKNDVRHKYHSDCELNSTRASWSLK